MMKPALAPYEMLPAVASALAPAINATSRAAPY
jgi:hypothetical protein